MGCHPEHPSLHHRATGDSCDPRANKSQCAPVCVIEPVCVSCASRPCAPSTRHPHQLMLGNIPVVLDPSPAVAPPFALPAAPRATSLPTWLAGLSAARCASPALSTATIEAAARVAFTAVMAFTAPRKILRERIPRRTCCWILCAARCSSPPCIQREVGGRERRL